MTLTEEKRDLIHRIEEFARAQNDELHAAAIARTLHRTGKPEDDFADMLAARRAEDLATLVPLLGAYAEPTLALMLQDITSVPNLDMEQAGAAKWLSQILREGRATDVGLYDLFAYRHLHIAHRNSGWRVFGSVRQYLESDHRASRPLGPSESMALHDTADHPQDVTQHLVHVAASIHSVQLTYSISVHMTPNMGYEGVDAYSDALAACRPFTESFGRYFYENRPSNDDVVTGMSQGSYERFGISPTRQVSTEDLRLCLLRWSPESAPGQ